MNSKLIHEKENSYFVLAVVISVISYLALILTGIGIIYIIIGFLITTIPHYLSIAYIRSNAVKLTENQFPDIHQKVIELSTKMGVNKIPDVYVMESAGFLNAFATRFFGRNFVVLYSSIFELMKENREEELTFVISHELAHLKRNHVLKQVLILPALWIPFLGDAYSRAAEYTCDRMAVAYTGNAKAGIQALVTLAVGKKLSSSVNVKEYIIETEKEKGFFIWLSRVLSTHPPTPSRIKEIEYFHEYPQLFGYVSTQFETENSTSQFAS